MTPGAGTIAAIATPAGRGGLGMVRISGPEAAAVCRSVFRPEEANGDRPPHARARFGLAVGPDGASLDRGYLTFFRGPRSYTGEDTAEISLHGSPYLLRRLLDAAFQAGARAAEPGEFTWRAFRNGRLDLAQAEAVDDLVEARTAHQARVAFEQVEGALSRRLSAPRQALLDLIARLEAGLEFSEEEETALPREQLRRRLRELQAPLQELASSYHRGRILRDGATAVLAGLPNVGKSSLFNRLVGEPRAIVRREPGTTRDLVSETIDLAGVPLRLVDTAGVGDGGDAVEAEGMRRAEEARRGADLVLLVLDRSRPLVEKERALLSALPPDGIVILNKSDLTAKLQKSELPAAIPVSALRGDGLEELREALAARLGRDGGGDVPLTRRRQHEEIKRCLDGLARAAAAAESGAGDELILTDLDEARGALGRLTGEIGLEDLYDRIFSTFCIGK